MIRVIILFVLLLYTSLGLANDDWIEGPFSDEYAYSYQSGSFAIIENKLGAEVAIIVSRLIDKKTKQITLGKLYVATSDCAKKSGKIVSLNLDGVYLFENDFIHGAGSLASANAEFICAVYSKVQSDKLDKGI